MSPADQYGSQLDVLAHVNAKAKQPAPDDWCYVNNFKDAYHPKAVRLGRQRPRICAGYEEFVKVARWSFLGRSSENYEKNEINEVVQRRRGPLTELSTRPRSRVLHRKPVASQSLLQATADPVRATNTITRPTTASRRSQRGAKLRRHQPVRVTLAPSKPRRRTAP